MGFLSTLEVSKILGVNVSTLSVAVWNGRIERPAKGPGNSYCWLPEDINNASQVLLGKPYAPPQEVKHG